MSAIRSTVGSWPSVGRQYLVYKFHLQLTIASYTFILHCLLGNKLYTIIAERNSERTHLTSLLPQWITEVGFRLATRAPTITRPNHSKYVRARSVYERKKQNISDISLKIDGRYEFLYIRLTFNINIYDRSIIYTINTKKYGRKRVGRRSGNQWPSLIKLLFFSYW